MTQTNAAPRPDVNDMVAVHGVFRDTLGAAPALIDGASDGDAARVALIANCYDDIFHFLEVHHESARSSSCSRCCASAARRTPRSSSSSKPSTPRRSPCFSRRRRAVTALEAGNGDAAPAARDAIESLRSQLVGHLDNEEASVLPLCAAYLSPEEWGAIPGHGLANYRGDKVWLILGLIRERMNGEQRAAMLEHMPPPAREMWTGFGEQAFNEPGLPSGGRGAEPVP